MDGRVQGAGGSSGRTCDQPHTFVQRNFGKPVEYALVKQHPWSNPVLLKMAAPLTPDGEPWPLDPNGKPIMTTAA